MGVSGMDNEGCKYFRMPKSNLEFWQNKIQTNVARDEATYCKIQEMGWIVLVVWECELRTVNRRNKTLPDLYEKIIAPVS